MCEQKRYPVKSGMVFVPAQLRAISRYSVNWQPKTANEDGDGYKNVTYKWICAASNRAYSISFISSNVGKLFWSWILKDSIKVPEKKKKVVVFCSRPRQNVKIRQFHDVVVQRRQRNVQKKLDARAKLLFCLSFPDRFCATLWCSMNRNSDRRGSE